MKNKIIILSILVTNTATYSFSQPNSFPYLSQLGEDDRLYCACKNQEGTFRNGEYIEHCRRIEKSLKNAAETGEELNLHEIAPDLKAIICTKNGYPGQLITLITEGEKLRILSKSQALLKKFDQILDKELAAHEINERKDELQKFSDTLHQTKENYPYND